MKKVIFIFIFLFIISFINAQMTTLRAVLANPCKVALSKSEFQNQLKFSIYPNPSSGIVYITINSTTKIKNPKIALYDIRGILIYENNFENDDFIFEKSLPLQKLSSGVYLLSIITDVEKVTKKIIIK